VTAQETSTNLTHLISDVSMSFVPLNIRGLKRGKTIEQELLVIFLLSVHEESRDGF